MGWAKGEIVLWCSWMKKLNCRKRRHRHRTDFHSWLSRYATFLGISLPISNPQWKLIHKHRGEIPWNSGEMRVWNRHTSARFCFPVSCTVPYQLMSATFPPSPSTRAWPISSHDWLSPPPARHHFGFPQLFLGRDAEASVSQHLSLHFLTVTNGKHLSVESLLHS